MKPIKTTQFFGLELDRVNEVYVLPKPVCRRTIYIHPDVVKENGDIDFPDKPIKNCNIVDISYFKAFVIVPGEHILRFFDTNGGEIDIEGISGDGLMKDYVEETRSGKFIKVMMLGKKDGEMEIEWTDKNGNKLLTTIKMETGEMETIPNPYLAEEDEDD